jgi:Fur family peroxide stress response transcriptional regulator
MDGMVRKHSKKRDQILTMIRSTLSHPSAHWVYEQLKPVIPGLSLGTVYRNISLFLEEGEVISVGVVRGEERFDGRVRPHPHFVCSRCGKIIDIPGPAHETLEDAAKAALGETPGAASLGELASPALHIDHRRTVFYGLCEECHRETGNPTAGS